MAGYQLQETSDIPTDTRDTIRLTETEVGIVTDMAAMLAGPYGCLCATPPTEDGHGEMCRRLTDLTDSVRRQLRDAERNRNPDWLRRELHRTQDDLRLYRTKFEYERERHERTSEALLETLARCDHLETLIPKPEPASCDECDWGPVRGGMRMCAACGRIERQ